MLKVVDSSEAVAGALATHLADPATGWSMGTFGAIAEFTRDDGEPVVMTSGQTLSALTSRGGISLQAASDLRLIASESITTESWSQRVALCLPHALSAMHRRTALTGMGPDIDAMREQDREAVLFDLGLGTAQVDVYIRVGDPSVAAELRPLCGRAVFAHDNPAMHIILRANPHRVFLTKLGRAEVFQPIPPPDGKSPEGPHTHILPRLLKHGLTHSANEPIPEGLVPCAHFYPVHPIKDSMGRQRPYDRTAAESFADLLRAYGDPVLINLKSRVAKAVAANQPPDHVTPNGRFSRTSIRVALRQLKAAGAAGSLAAWSAMHDSQRNDDAEEGAGADHH
ncbi:MAG: hypothetical protein JO254_11330 [Pseudolabrys sp.]|nr:hypothetical protein [Pseudolabrys sp.]